MPVADDAEMAVEETAPEAAVEEEVADKADDMFASTSPAPQQDNEAEEDDQQGEYVPATETTEARIPSFRKKTVDSGNASADGGQEEEDDDAAEESRQRRKKKKRDQRRAERAAEVDEDEEPVDEATARRLAIEERIEAIGKKQRTTRKKKKDGEGVDVGC